MSILRLIAAMPFLVCGLFCFGACVYGVVKVANRAHGDPRDHGTMSGAVFCAAISMVLLPVGAWIAGAWS